MTLSRRKFLALGGVALAGASVARAADHAPMVLGQGDFRYRLVPGWGILGEKTPVKNYHGIVSESEGNIILLTDETTNNFIVYDPSGKLLRKWGTAYL